VLCRAEQVRARYVVLAVGAAGLATVPPGFETTSSTTTKLSPSPPASPLSCSWLHTGPSLSQTGDATWCAAVEHGAAVVPSAEQVLHSSEWYRFDEIKEGERVLVIGEQPRPFP
jgi:hypothetical protein